MHGKTVPLDTGKQQSMARLEALARLMDGAIILPGTTIRFGLDGIIGLIPVAGDGSGIGLSDLGSPAARRTKLADCADAGERHSRDHNRLDSGCGLRSTFCSGPT
jgi:hypothetical protein